MNRLVFVAAAAAVALFAPAAANAAACGLSDAKPLWIDFGAPQLQTVFARPGVTVAVTGAGDYPTAMRAAGAGTVFWDMYLNRRLGTPSAPADPGVLAERAQRLVDFAVRASGCKTPVIAMNELFGASLTTPWTPTNARYRQNVLDWTRMLAARGARPVLLVSSEPYTGGEAAQWWRDVAQAGELALEKYFSAAAVSHAGAVLGNRRMRTSMRRSVAKLLAVGVPPARIGLVLAFQTKRGAGGREGLQPVERWLSVAKWQALAARQVAGELGLGHVWSWGWGVYNAEGADPDKPAAACVWLWSRDPALCDAPDGVGASFDADRDEGQIDLSPGVRCVLGTSAVTTNAIGELARLTRDPELALSALYGRLVESRAASVRGADVLAAERAVIRERFRGGRAAYVAALARDRATLGVARGILADQLRRAALRARLGARSPGRAEVERFYQTYAPVLAREVHVEPAPSWLPGGRGVVLATVAPARFFVVPSGRTATVWSEEGPLRVTALGDAEPLGGLTLESARPAIVRALAATARVNAYHDWTARRQRAALSQVRCTRDRLPAIGAVELTGFLPYLAPTAAS